MLTSPRFCCFQGCPLWRYQIYRDGVGERERHRRLVHSVSRSCFQVSCKSGRCPNTWVILRCLPRPLAAAGTSTSLLLALAVYGLSPSGLQSALSASRAPCPERFRPATLLLSALACFFPISSCCDLHSLDACLLTPCQSPQGLGSALSYRSVPWAWHRAMVQELKPVSTSQIASEVHIMNKTLGFIV